MSSTTAASGGEWADAVNITTDDEVKLRKVIERQTAKLKAMTAELAAVTKERDAYQRGGKRTDEAYQDARRWAAAWKRAAKEYRADFKLIDGQANFLEANLNVAYDDREKEEARAREWRMLADKWRKRARKWKRRARAAYLTGYLTDGHGLYVMPTCPHCGGTRQVVRPGDIRCGECGR